MDLTWLALSVGAFAMLVVAYLAWSIGKQDAGTPQMDAIADYIEVGGKTFWKRERQTVRFELLIEGSCPIEFLSP
jgi:Na+/H+-translocating membrane pyrophosphatase